MKNKEKIDNSELLCKALTLCTEIQNKGIATVFYHLSGHITQISIAIHEPVWCSQIEPTYKGDCYIDYGKKELVKMIGELTKIAQKTALSEKEQQAIIDNKILAKEKAQYLQLKKKFEKTA